MPRKPSYDRNELIDRARTLFWKQGWAGTSLKDLEFTLQMKPGSFYAAFGSKDELFGLALDRYAEDGRKRLKALAADLGPLGSLRHYPVLILEDSAAPARACMLAKTLIELHQRNHPLAARSVAHLRGMETLFAELFGRAQTENEIAQDHEPVRLARKYQSDLMGLRVAAECMGAKAMSIALDIGKDLTRL